MVTFAIKTNYIVSIPKSSHFIGLPLYAQIVQLIDKAEVLRISQSLGGERYVKWLDAWTHLNVMLYAVIRRSDSLREITTSLQAETHKLNHMGIKMIPTKCTLADANKRYSEAIFEAIYRSSYAKYQGYLSSDSRSHRGRDSAWIKHLQIIDSTTISLFSNLIFKGIGRHPKISKKKGASRYTQ